MCISTYVHVHVARGSCIDRRRGLQAPTSAAPCGSISSPPSSARARRSLAVPPFQPATNFRPLLSVARPQDHHRRLHAELTVHNAGENLCIMHPSVHLSLITCKQNRAMHACIPVCMYEKARPRYISSFGLNLFILSIGVLQCHVYIMLMPHFFPVY
jgi:hypothetical protein